MHSRRDAGTSVWEHSQNDAKDLQRLWKAACISCAEMEALNIDHQAIFTRCVCVQEMRRETSTALR